MGRGDEKPIRRRSLRRKKLENYVFTCRIKYGNKEKRYVEISPVDADLFLIKMGGHFKRARDIAAKLEEEHKQRNEEHFRKKAIADKIREEKEEANKPVDVVVKPVKKNKAKVKVEDTEE